MKFRAVLFDLFGTLVPAFPEAEFCQSAGEMAECLGLEQEAFRKAWAFETWRDRATGVYETVEANLSAICIKLNADVTPAQLSQAAEIRVAFTRLILRPRSDALDVLNELRGSGIRLGLISDCSAEVPALWNELPLAQYFDVTVFSCVAGVQKPDARMYQSACEPLGIAPAKCMYVGDGFSEELAGARSVGMYPVLITVAGELNQQLEARTWEGERVGSLTEVLALVK